MTTTAKKGCLLFDRFPLNCFAGMTTTMDCFAFARNDDNNNGLLRSARNDDNGKKKDVYCLIDSRSTALRE